MRGVFIGLSKEPCISTKEPYKDTTYKHVISFRMRGVFIGLSKEPCISTKEPYKDTTYKHVIAFRMRGHVLATSSAASQVAARALLLCFSTQVTLKGSFVEVRGSFAEKSPIFNVKIGATSSAASQVAARASLLCVFPNRCLYRALLWIYMALLWQRAPV